MRNIVIENKNIFLKLLIAKNIPVINTMLIFQELFFHPTNKLKLNKNEKKIIILKKIFFKSKLKKNIPHIIIGHNLNRKLPKTNSSLKKLEILKLIILKPKRFVPVENCKITSNKTIKIGKISNKYIFLLDF